MQKRGKKETTLETNTGFTSPPPTFLSYISTTQTHSPTFALICHLSSAPNGLTTLALLFPSIVSFSLLLALIINSRVARIWALDNTLPVKARWRRQRSTMPRTTVSRERRTEVDDEEVEFGERRRGLLLGREEEEDAPFWREMD